MSQLIEVPGMGQVEFPDGMSDAEITAAIQRSTAPAKPAPSGNFLDRMDAKLGFAPAQGATELDKWKNAAANVGSAIARPAAQAIMGIPNMVADFGQASAYYAKKGYNALRPKGLSDLVVDRGPQVPKFQSQRFNEALDQYTRAPQGLGDKLAEAGMSAVLGSRIPMPSFAADVPANFRPPPPTPKAATLQAGQDAGLVVPPSSVNPSTGNRLMESLGGKIATEQDAALKNMPVFNRLARQSIGMAPDAPITPEALSGIRATAAAPYAAVRGAGTIKSTKEFTSALDDVVAPFKNAAKDFPGIADDEVLKVADAVRKESFDSSSAVDALAIIRDKAAKAFASGDKTKGKAFRGIADAIENVVEQNLKEGGNKDLLNQFRDARTLIAKTYSVEKALNPATGNVSGTKLAQQLTRGKPLSGDLLTAARFGQAFPKAAREVVDSGAVRNTDVLAGGATALVSGQPSWLMYPLLRQGVRQSMLSPAMQSALQGGAKPPSPWVSPLLMGGVAGQSGVW
jgi:hypothetical protein